MKCRVIYRPDGTVVVIHPAPKARQITVTYTKKGLDAFSKKYPDNLSPLPAPGVPFVFNDCSEVRINIPYMKKLGGVVEVESDSNLVNRVYQKAIKGTELEGLLYGDIDPTALPDRKDRDKLRGKKGEGIRVDHSIVTMSEKRQAIEDGLDAELAQTNPDPVKAMKLQRKLEKRDY